MQLGTALAFVALGGALLCLGGRARLVAVFAACAAALEVAITLGVLTLGISGFSVPLVLGAVLAVCGGLMWLRTEAKTQVAAATLVTAVGVIQVLGAIKLLKG